MLSYCFTFQAELSGDRGAVEVLEEADSSKAAEVSQEMMTLVEEQIERQTALEVKQLEEIETVNKELDNELKESQAQITDQLEEQKEKVRH